MGAKKNIFFIGIFKSIKINNKVQLIDPRFWMKLYYVLED